MTSAEAFSKRFLCVDSRDRNPDVWPRPSEYEVKLNQTFRGVSRFSIRSYSVPTVYPVSQGRNTVRVVVDDVEYQITVSMQYEGPGDAAAFLRILETELGNQTGEAWSVGVDADTGYVRFECAGKSFAIHGGDPDYRINNTPNDNVRKVVIGPGINNYGLLYPESQTYLANDGYGPRSAGRVLGLDRVPQSSVFDGTGHVVIASYKPRFDDPEALYLHVDNMELMEGTERAASMGIIGSYEMIGPRGNDGTADTKDAAVKRFHPPMSRLDRLKVRVVDYYGVPANFDNREHRLDFVVETDPLIHGRDGYGVNEWN